MASKTVRNQLKLLHDAVELGRVSLISIHQVKGKLVPMVDELYEVIPGADDDSTFIIRVKGSIRPPKSTHFVEGKPLFRDV